MAKDFRQTSQGRRALPARPAFARRSLQHLFQVPGQRRVVVLARLLEHFDQLIVGDGVDVRGAENGRLSTRGDDLGFEPFQVLASAGGIRQGVDRLLERDRADLLQAAPRADAQVGGRRRQLMERMRRRRKSK